MMNKVKVSTGLASLVLVASIFAGIGTLLTVIALLLIFCEVDNIKGVIVRVASFMVGVLLFQALWGLLVNGYDVITGLVDKVFSIINNYLDEPIEIGTKLHKYLFDPVRSVISACDSVVDYFILLIKFLFVVSFLEGKVAKENFVSKFVNKYVDKVVAFVNGIEG